MKLARIFLAKIGDVEMKTLAPGRLRPFKEENVISLSWLNGPWSSRKLAYTAYFSCIKECKFTGYLLSNCLQIK